MEAALQLEKSVNQALLDLHRMAGDQGDPHVSIGDGDRAGHFCLELIFFIQKVLCPRGSKGTI